MVHVSESGELSGAIVQRVYEDSSSPKTDFLLIAFVT